MNKHMVACLGFFLAFNSYGTTDEIVAQLHAENNYRGACERAIKLSRESLGHDAYYFAAICRDRYESIGVTKEEYIQWLEIASNNGDQGASYRLGEILETGGLIRADPLRALKYYRKARSQSDKEAFIPIVMKKIKYLELQTNCTDRDTTIFNEKIKCATRNSIDSAIVHNGGELKERKDNTSVFLSSGLLEYSDTLTAYYTKDDIFACIQYSLSNYSQIGSGIAKEITNKIVDKYGRSDDGLNTYKKNTKLMWTLSDGITIEIESRPIETQLWFCHPVYKGIMLTEVKDASKKATHLKRLSEDKAY